MKILSVGADFFSMPTDGQTDRHDKANSRFSQFFRTRLIIRSRHDINSY